MNIQEYISSGAIENYVLGLATADEKAEFESLCIRYPEIVAAREAFEILLEKRAMQNGINPPSFLKQRIDDQIRGKGKVIQLTSDTTPIRRMNWLRFAAAACFALLLGSIVWNINLNKENLVLKEDLVELTHRQQQMDSQMSSTQNVIGNPNVKVANLIGTDESPGSFARVYWDTASNDVYLIATNLPLPPSDKQYQLWALLNGQPIDMGMLEVTEKPLVLRMKNVKDAQAFAITLEKTGGSPAPEGKMYAMGKL